MPEFGNDDLRELFVRNYRLIYHVTADVVYIIGFIHGARELWRLWDSDRNI